MPKQPVDRGETAKKRAQDRANQQHKHTAKKSMQKALEKCNLTTKKRRQNTEKKYNTIVWYYTIRFQARKRLSARATSHNRHFGPKAGHQVHHSVLSFFSKKQENAHPGVKPSNENVILKRFQISVSDWVNLIGSEHADPGRHGSACWYHITSA